MHLLETVVPGLARRLQALPPEHRREVAVLACASASKNIRVIEPPVQRLLRLVAERHALLDSDVEEAKLLSDAADERYFGLREEGGDEVVWLDWFYKARLLRGIARAFGKESADRCADAIYEFLNTTNDPTSVIRVVEAALRARGGADEWGQKRCQEPY
jgi:hypothetical protein